MLNEEHRLLRNGNNVERRTLQRNIDKKITESKRIYKEKVEGLFKTNRVNDAWKGLKILCGHKKKQNVPEPEDINIYSRAPFSARIRWMNVVALTEFALIE